MARSVPDRCRTGIFYQIFTPFASGFAGYKDWFLQDFRRPGYTIEAGLGTNPLPLSQFDEIYRRNIGILVHALP